MLGGNDPDNRRPFNWKWEEDETAIDILSYYKSLIRTRKDNPLLRNGEFSFIGSKDMILSYKRFNESQCLVCCINLSNDGVEKATACKQNVIFDHPSVNIKEASILIPANGVCVYASTSPV
jgi:glycosidase